MQNNLTYFFLTGFPSLHHFKICVLLVIFVIYCLIFSLNALIICIVVLSKNLHSPMYFFISQVSLCDILLSTDIIPNMFSLILKEGGTISWIGCIAQFYFFTTTEGVDCLLLAVMSYDRFLAICNPLHYSTIANPMFCIKSTIGTCLFSVFLTVMFSVSMSKVDFCGANVIDHFFCDLTMLLEFACSDISVRNVRNEIFFVGAVLFISPLLVIVVSYVYIALCIVRMPTTTGRKKAFSTCSSHLTVVWLFYGSLISMYMVPKRVNLSFLNKMLAIFYTTITPMLNPIIYSLRNKEFRASFRKIMTLNIYW